MVDWIAAQWLWWMALYLILGVFVPWAMTRTWAHQHKHKVQCSPQKLFQRGELGIFGLVLAISVIWDLQRSQYPSLTIAIGSIILAASGMMAAAVWVESYCRETTGTETDPKRIWRDSRALAFLVFSVAAVTEILLGRLARAVRP